MVARLSLAVAMVLVSAGLDFSRLSARSQQQAVAAAAPSAADLERYRTTVERVFMTDRGGTTPGVAACVMCHTWQTSVRFSLETPATDAGWTAEQSRRNFAVVTKLINTADPESSRLLRKPLNPAAGGAGHTGGTYWSSRSDPEYVALLQWIRGLPNKYVPAPEPALDFEFFRACVQPVFSTAREGDIRCSNCHASGMIGFAPVPRAGSTWSDQEAKSAFQVLSRLIVGGNPE